MPNARRYPCAMPAIVLATVNARYAHASLGLRYLRANLGDLREQSEIVEFVLGQKTEEVVEQLLARAPRIVGLGVYIWNVDESTRIVAQLKLVAPHVTVIVGGPEVSHEVEQQRICRLADFAVTGWGDVTFADLARQVLNGPRPLSKVHAGVQPALDTIVLPYDEYSDLDLRQRYIYVEASRGCPFKCEFCLSALDKTAWPFPLEAVLASLDGLLRRGARHFKFVDRTFNLKVEASARILRFFLEHLRTAPQDPPFIHFELIPDHLPEALKSLIAQFPAGVLQFEIGIQTFNTDVQRLISRRQDNAVAETNLRWLREHTQAHLHVDLIAGLPGEDADSFAHGFDRLVALAPHEVQVGILKRLRGAPIARHRDTHDLRFNPDAPYNLLSSSSVDFATMQRLSRFARYWDLIANSGRFTRTLPRLLLDAPFARFAAWSDWLYAQTGKTAAIANERLYNLLHVWLTREGGLDPESAAAVLADDYLASGARGKLAFVDIEALARARRDKARLPASTPARQARHLQA
jgi:radical SAM superfamily enzyme YgiQ (UPF0313 family)